MIWILRNNDIIIVKPKPPMADVRAAVLFKNDVIWRFGLLEAFVRMYVVPRGGGCPFVRACAMTTKKYSRKIWRRSPSITLTVPGIVQWYN